jgi:CheY-like chemotaxis protein
MRSPRMDAVAAASIIKDDLGIDDRFRAVLRQLITFMMEDPRTISAALDCVWVAKAIERIGDHAKNVAEHVIFISQGWDARHKSLEDSNAQSRAHDDSVDSRDRRRARNPGVGRLHLHYAGLHVRRADSVGAGRDAIDRELPDMVLLELDAADKLVLELLKDLRAQERTRVMPVIMLTAKGNEADK